MENKSSTFPITITILLSLDFINFPSLTIYKLNAIPGHIIHSCVRIDKLVGNLLDLEYLYHNINSEIRRLHYNLSSPSRQLHQTNGIQVHIIYLHKSIKVYGVFLSVSTVRHLHLPYVRQRTTCINLTYLYLLFTRVQIVLFYRVTTLGDMACLS